MLCIKYILGALGWPSSHEIPPSEPPQAYKGSSLEGNACLKYLMAAPFAPSALDMVNFITSGSSIWRQHMHTPWGSIRKYILKNAKYPIASQEIFIYTCRAAGIQCTYSSHTLVFIECTIVYAYITPSRGVSQHIFLLLHIMSDVASY